MDAISRIVPDLVAGAKLRGSRSSAIRCVIQSEEGARADRSLRGEEGGSDEKAQSWRRRYRLSRRGEMGAKIVRGIQFRAGGNDEQQYRTQ